MIDFAELWFSFGAAEGREQKKTLAARFGSAVNKASTALIGWDLGYRDDDHHVYDAKVMVENRTRAGSMYRPGDPSMAPDLVYVTATIALRDSSGYFDDKYDGEVRVLVIVDRA